MAKLTRDEFISALKEMNLLEKKWLFLWPQGKAGFKTQNVQMPSFAEFDVLVWKTRFFSHSLPI